MIKILWSKNKSKVSKLTDLETFPVDDGWARFVIFLLADPHLLEGGEGRQDGTSDPYGVFPFWGCNDLDLHGFVDPGSLHSQEGRLEDSLGTSEPFIADSDDLAVGKFVA